MIKIASQPVGHKAIEMAISSVPETETFRARDVLRRNPELGDRPSVLLDLAYEEYCQANDNGKSIDPSSFASQFPEVENELLKLLDVHSFVFRSSWLSCPRPPAHWPTSGDCFLGFQLNEEIGRGAFSRVFLASERDVGSRQVVVKISESCGVEANMLGTLNHPNIVPVYSVQSDEVVKLSALCMPYLGRTTVADWIQTRFNSAKPRAMATCRHLDTVAEIGKGVCQGLHYAHNSGVLHCDIKPSNVLISNDCEPILLDFNLSANRVDEIHVVGGTLNYMAPEQISVASGDQTASIDESTDVFGLGATLFEMATGRSPFQIRQEPGSRLDEVLANSLNERRNFLIQETNLAEPLRSILRDALAFQQCDRISSAVVFFDRLSSLQKTHSRSRSSLLRSTALAGVAAVGLISSYTYVVETDDNTDGGGAGLPSAVMPSLFDEPFNDVKFDIVAINDRFSLARTAEEKGVYANAIDSYYSSLDLLRVRPNRFENERQFVIRSLMFCLIMEDRLEEAKKLVSELNGDGTESIRSCLNEPQETDQVFAEQRYLKGAIAGDMRNAKLKDAAAILYALDGSVSFGQAKETKRKRAQHFRKVSRPFEQQGREGLLLPN